MPDPGSGFTWHRNAARAGRSGAGRKTPHPLPALTGAPRRPGVGELVTAIQMYIDAHNADPKPFVGTASAASMLEKVNRCQAISSTDH
jgi:hypothetical protein